MGKHSAPHTNYDGTPLPLVHFPGPYWREGALTPCGERYIERSSMSGQLVTAAATARDPRLVNCEACYAAEDIKHRQDPAYGRHSRIENDWLLIPRLGVALHATHPTPPGNVALALREDARPGNDGLQHLDADGVHLWWK